MNIKKENKTAYQEAGVNIKEANETVDLIKPFIHSTYNDRVIRDIGLFGGLIDVSFLKEYKNPVLVQSIDGVGTKMIIAQEMKSFKTIGEDIINHCVNDILAQGAEPISFLDYIASGELKKEIVREVILGMSQACQDIGCKKIKLPIIGGETAEMPGVYHKECYDLVGCITGIVEKDNIIDGSKIEIGDVLIGLTSNGIHTNGCSLARKAFFKTAGYGVDTYLKELDHTIGEELLRPHKCYYRAIHYLVEHYAKVDNIRIHGIVHVTGGGFYDNIGRVLKKGLRAEINQKWQIPSVFSLIQKIEKVSNEEMRRVFNLGIGMILIVSKEDVRKVRFALTHQGELDNIIIGEIKKAEKEEKVIFTY